MLCPVDGEKMSVAQTFEKKAKVVRKRQCLTCGFRCSTVEVITDTRAFVRALREIAK